MIDLRPAVLDRFAFEIAQLPRFGCWAKVVVERPNMTEGDPEKGCVRFHVYRNVSGEWLFTLEELDRHLSEYSSRLHWTALFDGYDGWGNPQDLCECTADDEETIGYALELMAEWTRRFWRTEGEEFADWIEAQWPQMAVSA